MLRRARKPMYESLVRLGPAAHRIKKAEFHWVSVLGIADRGVVVCVFVFGVVCRVLCGFD